MWDSLAEAAAPAHVARVLDAVRLARPGCRGLFLVAVDGHSGSGKSTLARSVADALRCPVLRMDDFYPGWDGLAEAVRILAEQVIAPLCRGDDVTVPTWDWVADRPGPPMTVSHTDRLVVDGVGSTVRPAGEHAAVRVWVEADAETRYRRAIARDGDAFVPHWDRWADQEAAVFAADHPRSRADVIIDTSTL